MPEVRALIVEDGLSSYVLPVARSLARSGWTVDLARPRPGRSDHSRHIRERHHVPPAEHGLDAFAGAVARIVETGAHHLVFGADDVEVLALSATRDRFAADVPYAPDPVVRRAFDKRGLADAAATAGLTTPRVARAAEDHPVVVKASLHWQPGVVTGSGRLSAAICRTSAEVDAAIATIRAAGGEPLVQELIDGDLMALTLLLDRDGRVVARAQQRAAQISPFLRTSVRAVTEPVDEALAESATRMLRDLGWFGLANLQFLAPRGGHPALIDFNGRVYGSVALAIRAGADFPAWWAALAIGRPLLPQPDARAGVRYQALEEDLRRIRHEHRQGLTGELVGAVRYACTAAHSTWSARDPLPAVHRARRLLHPGVLRRFGQSG